MSKKAKSYRDPYAQREASQYERPVASRELILQVLEDHAQPLTRDQLEPLLDIHDEVDQEALRRRLKAMVRDGQLVENRRGQYGLVERMALIKGRVQGHRDGYGFLVTEDAGEDDLYLSPRQMRLLLDGDRVLAAPDGYNRFGKKEARVVEIIERGQTEIVGTLVQGELGPSLTPINRRLTADVRVMDWNGVKVTEGDHVRAEIVHYPTPREPQVLVRLLERIASPSEPGMEVDVALRSHDIPFEWPREVEREAAAIPDEVPESAKKGRVDLRDLPLVTIDGEDARDFDDAVYVHKKGWRRGWRLVVAIADVSHYVQPGSPLDQEARRRATSVYFPNRVVPMLPEKLSNGLCSLNPDVDRLCMFCEIHVSHGGRISKWSFGEGVMRSHRRLTYEQVGAWLEQPDSDEAQALDARLDKPLRTMLQSYLELYRVLRARREERGAIDFETVETRILYDEQKKIRAIVPATRNVAHMMIEEAMLAANICAAKTLEEAGVPALYRNHEPPKAEKLLALRDFLGPLGVKLDWNESMGDASPAVFQALNERIEGRPDKVVIQTMMLRSLTQARYTAENKGHFGLAYGAYTHFTSPIRRYPDLLVHRALRFLIRNGKGKRVTNPHRLPKLPMEQALPYDQNQMVLLGEHCSMAERRADDASRDVVQWLKCQYMEQHLGEVFDGVISGVTSFGLFVQVNDLYVDGLVHVATLENDYYRYDDRRHQLVGESSGRTWKLGDAVRVQVAAVHVEDRKIDFQMAPDRPARGRGRGGVRQSLREGKIPSGKAGVPVRSAGRAAEAWQETEAGARKGGRRKGASADPGRSGGATAPAGRRRTAAPAGAGKSEAPRTEGENGKAAGGPSRRSRSSSGNGSRRRSRRD